MLDNPEEIPLDSKYGSFIGGLPGPGSFFTTPETLEAAKGSRKAFWESVQQNVAGREKTYLPAIRSYHLVKTAQLPRGRALANPQFGKGGGILIYITPGSGIVMPVLQLNDFSMIEMLSSRIKDILDYEISQGNEIDFIDRESAGVVGVILKKPMNISALMDDPRKPTNIEPFHCDNNLMCAPEAGFVCLGSRQYITAPTGFIRENGRQYKKL